MKRRDFIKIGAAGSSLILLSRISPLELKFEKKHISRTTGRTHVGIPTTCLNCYARCGIIAYIEADRLIKIGGNPDHPNSRGRMCAKGHAGIQMLYDPERILHPIKRIGKRGEGKWKSISWNEAYREIAMRLKKLWEKGHPERFVFLSTRDITTQDFIKRFMHAFGSPNALVNVSLTNNNKRFAQKITWGAPYEINDVLNCRYMLNFGCNPFENHILRTSFVQRITEGRLTKIIKGKVFYGAKLVTFDVRCSQTAGKSDEWFSPFPGTDGLIALTMANVIMQENLYDESFLKRWTNYPVQELKNHLKQFTPEKTEKETGIHSEDIIRIALEFGQSKPATTISTGGVSKHLNGVLNERAVILLNIITGNIDIKGGYCLPRYYEFSEPHPKPPSPEIKSNLIKKNGYEAPFNFMEEVKGEAGKIEALFTYQANPAYEFPDTDSTIDVLKNENLIPFHVSIDTHLTETSELADIVLPSATYLERWELDSPPSLELIPFVSLRQPVVKPLGKTKSIMEILIELSDYLNGNMKKYFFFDPEDYLASQISEIDELIKEGGLDYLKDHGFWVETNAKPEFRIYERKGFDTPSKKIEIYSEKLKEMGLNPLPSYEPIPIHKNIIEKGEFVLTTFQWNIHTHFHTANSLWLSEIVHRNPILMNKEAGEKMNLKTGDTIKVTSKIGSLEGEVFLVQGIHPNVIAISDNCGHWAYGKIAQAKKFKSDDPLTELLWWEKERNGIHPNQIIPVVSDPLGGGQAFNDTTVSVYKLAEKKSPGFFEKYIGFLFEK
ncbi:MAG: molybdopterin-dependent oxidoreductase [Acidobacteriota bacterium]